MKKWIYGSIGALSLAFMSFKIGESEGIKKYKVEQDLVGWQYTIGIVQGLQSVAGNPEAKYSDVMYLRKGGDSVINTIAIQVNPQLPKDTTKKK